MASVPKGEMKAEVKAEVKQEPKEQREPKKPNTPVLKEKPSSPKGSPGPVRKEVKENGPKKENTQVKSAEPAKLQEQKNAEKKETTTIVVKKETSPPPKAQELTKSPDTKKKEASEKRESPEKDKTVQSQKTADAKNSSPEKNASATPNEKTKTNIPAIELTLSEEAAVNPMAVKTESAKVESGTQSAKKTTDGVSITNIKEQSVDKTENKSKATSNTEVKSEPKEDKQSKKPQKDEGTEKIDTDSQAKMKSTASSQENEDKKDNDKKEQSNDTNNNEAEAKTGEESPKPKNGKHDSKNQLRMEIWNKMFRSSMLAFRKPCNYRIPHFKGDVISAGRLSVMEIFQNAQVVKVSLDKAHECVRLQVIEAGKEMIVGCPGLREAVFLHVKPPMEPSKSSNRLASSRIGIGHVGTALDFTSGTQADLVIVGSVAVDRTGLRVGKGEGFADLEYALLKKLGGIAPNAPIVTVVHDSQVYDTLPENLFKEHDVPADYIVTPTEVIEISPKRKHPDLIWNILSNRRVNSIPIIKQLLDREQNREGATNTSLKDEDTDSEELEQIAKRKRYFMRRRAYSTGSQRGRGQMVNRNNNQGNMNMRGGRTRRHTAPSERTMQEPMMMMAQNRPTRTFRSRAASMANYNYPQQNMKQNGYWMQRNFNNGMRQRNNRFQSLKPKYCVDFSLKVQGLTNEIRVRDLKAAVIQRGIRPRDISWLPHKGVAFLHFVKQKNMVERQQTQMAITDTDTVLASLKDLIVKAENGPETNVKIEAAQPFRKVHFIL